MYSRLEAGHWEADTVVSGQGKSKACFATLAERKTRFYIAVKMPDRRAETMENAIVSALSAFPPQLVKTITCDRGTEFANWRRIEERLQRQVIYATLENTRLLQHQSQSIFHRRISSRRPGFPGPGGEESSLKSISGSFLILSSCAYDDGTCISCRVCI